MKKFVIRKLSTGQYWDGWHKWVSYKECYFYDVEEDAYHSLDHDIPQPGDYLVEHVYI